MDRYFLQKIFEILIRSQVVSFGSLRKRKQNCACVCPIDRIDQDEILSGYHEIPDLALGFGIIQWHISGRQTSQKVVLLVHGIRQSFSGLGFWRNGFNLGSVIFCFFVAMSSCRKYEYMLCSIQTNFLKF